MKIFFLCFVFIATVFANNATIEVIKKVDSLPGIAIEDASMTFDDTFKLKFFKSLIADLNVLSLFNVDRHHVKTNYNDTNVAVANKNFEYVLRYKLSQDDNEALGLELKLLQKNEVVFTKTYKTANKSVYMFLSHAIAYDVNEFMGAPSVAWMKKQVVFARVTNPKESEIVLSDYTLTYQHTVVKSGFNVFPKWANLDQSAFYYTSLDGQKPTLKYVDLKSGKVTAIQSSDGMIVCSDVSNNGKKILLTMAPNGQPDIYLYDVPSKNMQKLTKYSGIDVNGQFLGEDKIAFISNRLGYPNVFSKDLKSGIVEQMVYYGKNNSSCTTNGSYVVYKARESANSFDANTFNLHLISTQTDFIRRLTATGVNEFPRFSKDGDAILFIKNYKMQSSLGVIRLQHNKNYLFPLASGKIQSMDW